MSNAKLEDNQRTQYDVLQLEILYGKKEKSYDDYGYATTSTDKLQKKIDTIEKRLAKRAVKFGEDWFYEMNIGEANQMSFKEYIEEILGEM